MIRFADSGDWIGTFEGHRGAVNKIRLNSNATLALTASSDFSAKLWDATNGTELHSFAHKHIVRACDFAPSAPLIVTSGSEKVVKVFDLNKYEAVRTLDLGFTKSVHQTLFSPVNPNILYVGGEEAIKSVDTRTDTVISTFECPGVLASFQINDDVMSICTGKDAVFMKLDSAGQLNIDTKRFSFPKVTNCVSRSKNGTFVLSFKDDVEAKKYNKDGVEIDTLKGHHGLIGWVTHAPDGRITTGADDGTIRLWEEMEVMEPLALN